MQNFLKPKSATEITAPRTGADNAPGFHRRAVGQVDAGFTLFEDPDFKVFLEHLVNRPLSLVSQRYEEYKAGDYSLLDDDTDRYHRLVVKYDLTPEWLVDWGGFDLYTHPDADPVIGHREFGALTMARLGPEGCSCVRYINHLAGEHRARLVVGVYRQVKP